MSLCVCRHVVTGIELPTDRGLLCFVWMAAMIKEQLLVALAVLLFVRIVNGMKMLVKTHVGRVQLPHSGAVHPRQLLLEEDNNELALDNPWSGIKV